MNITEILDRAVDLARDSKSVAIVAFDTKQREVLRRGLRRRLEAHDSLGCEWLVTLLVPGARTQGLRFDEVFIAPGLDAKGCAWVDVAVRSRMRPEPAAGANT